MLAKKTIVAAAALAALTAAGLGGAAAQPRDHQGPAMRHEMHRDVHRAMRHEIRRPYVAHARVFETLRLHRYVGLGNPYFFRGRYVVRSHDRFGHVVLVQIDPYTGAYIGVVRM